MRSQTQRFKAAQPLGLSSGRLFSKINARERERTKDPLNRDKGFSSKRQANLSLKVQQAQFNAITHKWQPLKRIVVQVNVFAVCANEGQDLICIWAWIFKGTGSKVSYGFMQVHNAWSRPLVDGSEFCQL